MLNSRGKVVRADIKVPHEIRMHNIFNSWTHEWDTLYKKILSSLGNIKGHHKARRVRSISLQSCPSLDHGGGLSFRTK